METRLSLEIFFQVTEDEVDGCYVAHAVGHNIVAQGATERELREQVRDAVHRHFGDSPDRPRIARLHSVRDEIVPFAPPVEALDPLDLRRPGTMDTGMEVQQCAEIVFEVCEDIFDGGYSASAIGFGIVTEGQTLKELHFNVMEAIDCHFDESDEDWPGLVRLPLRAG